MTAKGNLWCTTETGEAVIQIININRGLRDSILKRTIPATANQTFDVNVTIHAGHKDKGTAILYSGTVFRSYQLYKPNTGIELRCMSGYLNYLIHTNHEFGKDTKFSDVAREFAKDNNVKLSFEVEDKPVGAFTYDDMISGELDKLKSFDKDCTVYIDSALSTMIVRYKNNPSKYSGVVEINAKNGLKLISATEQGIELENIFTNAITINSQLNVNSEINSTLNGNYLVNNMKFDLSSRDDAFDLKIQAFRI